jgi:hypothetical protein
MKLDIIFTNAKIYDGLGNSPFDGSLGIFNDRIIYPVEEHYSAENVINLHKVQMHGQEQKMVLFTEESPIPELMEHSPGF